MNEPEPNQAEPQTPSTTEPEPSKEPPATEPAATEPGNPPAPWERDGEKFDPETAWKLIQHLRDENKTVNARNRELEDEKLTKQQRMERDLKEANEKVAAYEMRAAWAEARASHPVLTDEDFDLIGAGSPDEIKTKAAKFAARIEAQAASMTEQQKTMNPSGNPMLQAKPTGGSTPGKVSADDWLRSALEG